MSTKQDWIWHELMTTDPEAAAKFYGEVVGWTMSMMPAPDGSAVPEYRIGNVGKRGVVGIMGMPPGVPAGMKPSWTGYIHAPNVDETVKAVEAAGGQTRRAPWDIEGVGRVAVMADPEGGAFNLIQPPADMAGPPKLEQNAVGNVSWCELHSNNENNFDFYQKLFGWTVTDTMDMGEHGKYTMFTSNENPMTGGSMRKMKDGPEAQMPTYWLFYFSVDNIDAAVERTKSAGGTIFMGPHQVPGGTWIALGNDPQGVLFALHSQSK